MHVDTNECMLFAGYKHSSGYGRVTVKVDGVWKTKQLHREVYIAQHGELPKDLVIDHLCRNKACCNIDHLEAVTNGVNIRRGVFKARLRTHCKRGHEFTPENSTTNAGGYRICATCKRKWQYDYNKARRERNKKK